MTQLEKLEDIARTLHEAGAVGDAATILWAVRRIREYEKLRQDYDRASDQVSG